MGVVKIVQRRIFTERRQPAGILIQKNVGQASRLSRYFNKE
jgi:hypothetical protein